MKIILLFGVVAGVFGTNPRKTPVERIRYLAEFLGSTLPSTRDEAAGPLRTEDEAAVVALVTEFMQSNELTELEKFVPILQAANRLGLARADFERIQWTVIGGMINEKKRPSSDKESSPSNRRKLVDGRTTTPEPAAVVTTTAVPETTMGPSQVKSILVSPRRASEIVFSPRTPSRDELALVSEVEKYLRIPDWKSTVQVSHEMEGFAHANYKMALELDTYGLWNQLRILRDVGAPPSSIAYLFQSAYTVLMNRTGARMPAMASPPGRPSTRPMMDVLDELFRDPRMRREPSPCSNLCKFLADKAREGDLNTIEKILNIAVAAGTRRFEMANAFYPAYRILKK